MMNSPPRVLIIDDDQQLATMLNEFLDLHGYQVVLLNHGDGAVDRIVEIKPDLVVLDVMLPGADGFSVLRELRKTHNLPVIMLTARGGESDRILGLMAGADDYLPKPFNPLELVARINAVLKRIGSGAEDVSQTRLVAGPIQLDIKRKELTVNQIPIIVTAAEMRILEQLMRNPGEVLSRSRLTERALNRKIEPYDRSIDTLVSKLRRKLSESGVNGACIRSLRGHGYVFDEHQIDDKAK
jgi:two-component system response regulator CpxR